MIKDITDEITIDTDKISLLQRDENGFAILMIDGAKIRTVVPFTEMHDIMHNKSIHETGLAY